jgi:hypothetical protein
MSKTVELTPIEIREAGWNVLKTQLGLPGAIKFLLQYEKGEGNHTELRREIFKNETVESLIDKMKKDGKIS